MQLDRDVQVCGIFFVLLSTDDHVWFEDQWMVASLCDE
jgi:hypothetical protein